MDDSTLDVDATEAAADPGRWFDDPTGAEPEASFKDYDIVASANDFNVRTIVDFVHSGAVKIPGFQRNYVWDLRRASKLIESILIGLPIPQIFLYEEKRNSFLVVDGQQRLMTIYYFAQGRFPRLEKRSYLRGVLDGAGALPKKVLENDELFQNFNLVLPTQGESQPSRFHGRNYDTLDDYRNDFDLKVIRNVVIKQIAPREDDDSSVFEIFNRLNTGGVNLRAQEIRSSLYHSKLIESLHRVNIHPSWRSLIGLKNPDLHEKDIEILLRVFALVANGSAYKEPMSAFLTAFARKSRSLSTEKIAYMERLFQAFFESASAFTASSFAVAKSGRFNIAVFEAVFRAVCTDAFEKQNLNVLPIIPERLLRLKQDDRFKSAIEQRVGRTSFVEDRYVRARAILCGQAGE